MAKKARKDHLARARRRRRATGNVAVYEGGVSTSGQAGNITISDTPLPLRTEIDPAILANWSPAPPQPLPPRPTFVIDGGSVSPPFPPVDGHVPGTEATAAVQQSSFDTLMARDDEVQL